MEIGGCVNLFTNSSVWEGERGCLGELLQATRSVHLLQRRCAWGCPGRGEPGPTDDALSPGASQMTPCPLCLFNLQKKSPRSPLPRVRYLGVQCIFFSRERDGEEEWYYLFVVSITVSTSKASGGRATQIRSLFSPLNIINCCI